MSRLIRYNATLPQNVHFGKFFHNKVFRTIPLNKMPLKNKKIQKELINMESLREQNDKLLREIDDIKTKINNIEAHSKISCYGIPMISFYVTFFGIIIYLKE